MLNEITNANTNSSLIIIEVNIKKLETFGLCNIPGIFRKMQDLVHTRTYCSAEYTFSGIQKVLHGKATLCYRLTNPQGF